MEKGIFVCWTLTHTEESEKDGGDEDDNATEDVFERVNQTQPAHHAPVGVVGPNCEEDTGAELEEEHEEE